MPGRLRKQLKEVQELLTMAEPLVRRVLEVAPERARHPDALAKIGLHKDRAGPVLLTIDRDHAMTSEKLPHDIVRRSGDRRTVPWPELEGSSW